MPVFTKKNENELHEFLYHICAIHDADIESMQYDYKSNCLKLIAYNVLYKTGIVFAFHDVITILATAGNEIGDRETIVGLIAHKDTSEIMKYLKECSFDPDATLYFVMETFSGDLLHIVSRSVAVEVSPDAPADPG